MEKDRKRNYRNIAGEKANPHLTICSATNHNKTDGEIKNDRKEQGLHQISFDIFFRTLIFLRHPQ